MTRTYPIAVESGITFKDAAMVDKGIGNILAKWKFYNNYQNLSKGFRIVILKPMYYLFLDG